MITHSPAFKNSLLQVLISAFNAGSKVKIFDRSANPEKLLVTLDLSEAGGFVQSGDGIATLTGLPVGTVLVNGTATHADFIDGQNTVLFSASCGIVGSGAAIILSNVTLIAGSNFSLYPVTYRFP